VPFAVIFRGFSNVASGVPWDSSRAPGSSHRYEAVAAGITFAQVAGMTKPTTVDAIRNAVIGRNAVVPGPYGPRRMVYADYAASNRSLEFIEDYLRDQVLPFYANTHSESSWTGRQTTRLREEARRVVHRVAGGGPEDVVVFTGSGSTGAIDKLTRVLGICVPRELDQRYGISRSIPDSERPVVFIGPYEHHSNELVWRESIATVVAIPETRSGNVDLGALESALARYAERPLKIGSFSAASNVTGVCSDVPSTTALLHRHGALSFWDFAAAGSHLPVDMNPGAPELAKDAVFLSPHKFAGGPGSPGVLIAKRKLFRNAVPTVPGGGTITYVNAAVQLYADDPVAREEGGTPAIIESIRAALAFQLEQSVGHDVIGQIEDAFVRRAIASWGKNPKLVLLGNLEAPRLPILSFLIRHEHGFLHHEYVVALLSDLFGIQARGGCSCAGPYGHALLRIGAESQRDIERQVLRGQLGIKPGWTRISLAFFTSEIEFDYILKAVHFIAEHGSRLLGDYEFDASTGHWSHRDRRPRPVASSSLPPSALHQHLEEAAAIVECQRTPYASGTETNALSQEFEALRWFPLRASNW